MCLAGETSTHTKQLSDVQVLLYMGLTEWGKLKPNSECRWHFHESCDSSCSMIAKALLKCLLNCALCMPGAAQKRRSKEEKGTNSYKCWHECHCGRYACERVWYAHVTLSVVEMILQKSRASFRWAQEKRLRRNWGSEGLSNSQVYPFSHTISVEIILTQRGYYLSGLWKGDILGYRGLSRERRVVGSLVSIGNLGMGGRGYDGEGGTELLQNLKWGTEVIPGPDCITELCAGIFCGNDRWEFELQGLRHEVRNKLVNYFSTMDKNLPSLL